MNREQKAAAVEEIAAQISESAAVIAVDYRGLTVAQAAELRARLRDADARLRVVKNSLTERAAERAGAEGLKAVLEGPTALAFVRGDVALAAKALADAGRTLGTLAFKGGLLDGALLSADNVQAIARLPAREVLNAQLVGAVAAPLTGLARALNGLIGGLAMQLKAIADQGLLGGAQGLPTTPAGEEQTDESPPPGGSKEE